MKTITEQCGCCYYETNDNSRVYVGYCDKHVKEDLEENKQTTNYNNNKRRLS